MRKKGGKSDKEMCTYERKITVSVENYFFVSEINRTERVV